MATQVYQITDSINKAAVIVTLAAFATCTLSIVKCSTASAEEVQPDVSAERQWEERRRSCHRKSPETLYYERLSNIVLSATPLEPGDRLSDKPTRTAVNFDIDKDGHFSNWKFIILSGSVARDFWTLYAVASCPPQPSNEIKLPAEGGVSNYRFFSGLGRDTEECRLQQAYCLSRRLDAKYLYFPLIPASIVSLFTSTNILEGGMCYLDATNKPNWVGIPLSELWKRTQSPAEANHIIKSNKQLCAFLDEWSKFYTINPKPTREQVLAFAEELKGRYKSLLVQGEPEAPLP